MNEKKDDEKKPPTFGGGFTSGGAFTFGSGSRDSASPAPITTDSGASLTAPQNVFTLQAKPARAGNAKGRPAAPTFTVPTNASQNGENKPNTFEAWPSNFQESPWRQVDWSDETREALMESIRSYKPACERVPAGRVLLVGPVGAGKSSFISSVQSVFYGRVVNRAMVGSSSSSSTSFTKQLQSFQLYGNRERASKSMALVLSDMVGLGETNGFTLHDTLAIIKGHVPTGHTFRACSSVGSDTPGYVKEPSLAQKVHCVAFVVSALEVSSYPQTTAFTFHQLREHISALGVHQVALLTHVDKVCPKTAIDTSQVYKSLPVKQAMVKAGALLGMPISSIVPVKNYSEQLELEPHADALLLRALDHILQYMDLLLRDQPEIDDTDDTESLS